MSFRQNARTQETTAARAAAWWLVAMSDGVAATARAWRNEIFIVAGGCGDRTA